MLEDFVRARLGVGEFDGLCYFKVEGWWGVLEGRVFRDSLRSAEACLVEISCGEERLVEEEEEKDEEKHSEYRGTHLW